MSRLLQFLAVIAVVVLMLFAAGPMRALLALLLTSFECACPRLSFGTLFFAGCCVLWSSPHACRALSSSITAVASLLYGLAEMSRDTTVASMRAQVQAVQQSTSIADTSSAAYHEVTQQLHKTCEARERDIEASQASIKSLHLTIDKLNSKVGMYDRHYNVSAIEADRAKSQHQIQMLKYELSMRDEEIKRLYEAIDDQKESVTKYSNDMYSLARKNDELEQALAVKTKKVNDLEAAGLQYGRDMYQRDLQVAKFNSFKEILHQMVEAGGEYMLVSVLFVRSVAEKGVDLAELGVDEGQFLTYSDYAMAVVGGYQSPLLPQGGLRMRGIQYPLSGLRLVGTKILGAGHCPVVPSSLPVFSAPLPVLSAPAPAFSAPAPVFSAPPSAPSMGFTTFAAPAAPLQEAPRVSCPTPQPAPAPGSAPSGGFTSSSAHPVPPQQPTTASAPTPETSAPSAPAAPAVPAVPAVPASPVASAAPAASAASGAAGVRRGVRRPQPVEIKSIERTSQDSRAHRSSRQHGSVAAAAASGRAGRQRR